MSAGVVVAAFDVDGTLTTRDCVVPFLGRFTRPRTIGRAVMRIPRVVPALVRRDRDALKALAADIVLGGIGADRIEAEARAFASLVVAEQLRPDTLARLRWHRDAGHRVVLVSASFEVYLHHIGTALGVDAVLATRLEVDDSGRATGHLAGGNCRAAEKQRRLQDWLDGEGLARGEVTIWAYGDSAGDRELLAGADHPVWVNDPIPAAPG